MRSSVTILILADDLSGAADCAVAFTGGRRRGVAVAMDTAEGFDDAEVVALDLDTRWREAEDACVITRRAAQALHAGSKGDEDGGGPLVFKKIDSTLRGHVFAELAETLALSPPGTLALVAPAFPAMGRTTLAGRIYVRGVPLEETETWRHSGFTGQADLAGMAAGSGLRATRVGLETIRRGTDALREELTQIAAGEAQVVVCDAVEDADLVTVAEAAFVLRPRPLLVGSAGLAHALAAHGQDGKNGSSTALATPPTARTDGPVLIVVGSASSISHQQAAALQKAGVLGVSVAPATLRAGPEDATPNWRGLEEQLGRALAGGKDVVCTLEAEKTIDFTEGHLLSERLAALVAPHAGELGGLVATGGETARAILKTLGVRGLRLEREIEAGVALGWTEGGEQQLSRPLRVVTKAGAFGTPETLARCREALRGI